jgi:hypothetical protein
MIAPFTVTKSRKLNLFYKIENNMAPTYVSDCLPTTILKIKYYAKSVKIYILAYNFDHPVSKYKLSALE